MSNDLKPLALTDTKIDKIFALRKLFNINICFTQTNRDFPIRCRYIVNIKLKLTLYSLGRGYGVKF